MDRLQTIQDRLAPLKAALLNHPLYREIDRLESLQIFMSYHIFAVWDFMSLLKALQRKLSCVEVPWLPAADPSNSRLVNEIVLAEESDEDSRGGYASHFEFYHTAMSKCGASTAAIDTFLNGLRQGQALATALETPTVPAEARHFVRQTFEIIEGRDLCAIASAFTFGREDLLPSVFQRIVDELNIQSDGGLDDFKYYLDRHIGLDGDEHGPMAHRLILSLCGDNDASWNVVEQTAVNCLAARRELWDGIHQAIRSQKNGTATTGSAKFKKM